MFDPTIIVAFGNTVLISVLSMILGLIIGTIVAVMRLSANSVVARVAWAYVWIFRGTPVLLKILLWYNMALIFPTLGIPGFAEVKTIDVVTAFVAALLALGFNEGAYLSEVIRGGILAVDNGQREAASALGVPSRSTIARIVLPQAMPSIIPALGNQFIGLLKMSSFASVFSYPELLERVQSIYCANAKVMELLIVAAVWYIAATTVASMYFLERHFGRSSYPTARLGSITSIFSTAKKKVA